MIDSGRGGSIVNIASVWGMVGVGQIPQACYAASKGAIVNLTRELAAQWARKGVRVNTIAPGWFPSEMTDDTFADERSNKWITGRTPMGRVGEVHELDGALLFLASDASTFVTGADPPGRRRLDSDLTRAFAAGPKAGWEPVFAPESRP